MTFEYNIPHVDLSEEFNQNDGADAFFDINAQFEKKLTLQHDLQLEENSKCTVSVSITHSKPLDPPKGDSAVLQEVTTNIQNIRENKKRKSDAEHGIAKFISLAEGVHIYSSAVLRAKDYRKPIKMTKGHVTIPQSPLLLAKTRSRPVNYPSAEERVQKELEEMKSYKLKAQPVNKKLFEPVEVGRKVSRAPLVVEPFNLTEFKKKEKICTSTSPFHFKANPVPKGMLEHPVGVPEKKSLPLTVPHTPSFISKHKLRFQTIEEVDGKLVVTNKSPSHTNINFPKTHQGKTSPCPFSFEERNKMMIKHKEEKIKKVLEEEKEARNFRANPLPAFIKKIAKCHNESRSPSKCSQTSEDEERMFKAQPALVLQKSPFKPRLPEHSFTRPDNVVLHTEQRALERKQFEEHQKIQAQAIEAEWRRRKELEERKEQEEVARLRQQAVHKAQPIRYYKPIPEKSKRPVTSPATPEFNARVKKT